MLDAGPRSDPPDRQDLAVLLSEVSLARDRLGIARQGARAADQLQLRRDLLHALEAYASALAGRGAPLPYRLRDEIELYRGLGLRG
ncbi:hypothetical protein [Nocardioides sp.]|uniref:hypothetical protein n=1 Tax=Nocardioides sp. TaxID=35761 RepID=UPI0035B48437